MSRYIPEHPKKGSAAAYEWAERMRQARQKKARTKAAVREAGQLTEMQFFGPGGSLEVKKSKKNPGERWHKGEENVAHRYKKHAQDAFEKAFFAGVEAAHQTSGSAARKMGMNPRPPYVMSKAEIEHWFGKKKPKQEKTKKNPIAIYNPPAPKVVGTIYNKAIEIRAKKTGSDLAGKYKHVFGKNVKILGLDNGDVVIHHTGGKRLWISRKDYERSGGQHE